MRFFYSITTFSILQIVSVYSIGQFYVGLLGYYNNINTLCCANISCESTVGCSLLFEIEVNGLKGYSLGPVSRRPSESALTPAEAEAFQGDSVTNPVSFQFNKWPGGADVTVHVLDGETETLVDQFNYSVILYNQSNFYFRKRLMDETSKSSSLIIVFRYECGAHNGPPCFTDCIDHTMNETCPVSPSTNVTQIPTDIITFTGFSDHKCESKDADGNVLNLNCSTGSPNTSALPENETTVAPSSTPMTSESTSSNILNSTSVTTSTSKPESTSEKQTNTKLIDSFENISTFTLHVTKNPYDSKDPGKEVTTPTTPSQGVPTLDNSPTAYWPGIVGGVLGGVAVFAASAFICYWNRQKKLQKRQEIYNVNPKILRNFEEFEENGTSGRADVPMETEQY